MDKEIQMMLLCFIKHPNFLGITVLRNQKKKLKKAHMLKGCAAGFRVV